MKVTREVNVTVAMERKESYDLVMEKFLIKSPEGDSIDMAALKAYINANFQKNHLFSDLLALINVQNYNNPKRFTVTFDENS